MFQFRFVYLCILSIVGVLSEKVTFPNGENDENNEPYSYFDVESKTEIYPYFHIDAANIPCTNATVSFCENVNLYPTEYIESVLEKRADQFVGFFMEIRPLSIDDTYDEPYNLCETYRRPVQPQMAKNMHNDWRFVVNQPNYRQTINVEICKKRGHKCDFDDRLPKDYVSSCAQKYTEHTLLSLDDGGEFREFKYQFPTYCECELRKQKRKTANKRKHHKNHKKNRIQKL